MTRYYIDGFISKLAQYTYPVSNKIPLGASVGPESFYAGSRPHIGIPSERVQTTPEEEARIFARNMGAKSGPTGRAFKGAFSWPDWVARALPGYDSGAVKITPKPQK